jgi:hypothetical protein
MEPEGRLGGFFEEKLFLGPARNGDFRVQYRRRAEIFALPGGSSALTLATNASRVDLRSPF